MKKIILLSLLSIFLLSACSFGTSKTGINRKIDIGDDFAFDFFFEILEKDENAFVSPYSLETALTMTYLGADGETKKEMAEVLKLNNLDIEEIKERSLDLMDYLSSSENIEILIANAFYLKEGVPFLDSFTEQGEKYFKSEINNMPKNGQTINDWAKEKTRGKITEIINPGPIDPFVVAYLLNAIYFKADWKNQFNENSTTVRTFYSINGQTKTNMMNRKGAYYHLNEDKLKAIKIDYKDNNFSFYAFMPEDINYFYQNFDRNYFTNLKEEMTISEIELYFPKFKLEKSLKLIENLKNLGINQAFNSSLANFSNMVDPNKTGENIFISSVSQDTFIEVEEKGTEAAAVTTVSAMVTSVSEPIKPPIIEFNRPFIFLIEEKETNTLLFMGQLVNPNNN